MNTQKKIKIALVRGDSLKEQETRIWKNLGDEFATTAFCAKKNVFAATQDLPVERLPASSDSFFVKNAYKYGLGQYQRLFGLEKKIESFDIAHTVETFMYFTLQAVRAKRLNPRLKVVTSVLDNTFGRFEYNYWPGFRMPPAYWRNKINAITKECLAGVDLFLPVSNYSAEFLYELGANPKKVQVMYPGLVIFPTTDTVLKKYQLENQPFYLAVCRSVWEKGVYDILYAWKIYLQKNAGHSTKVLVMSGNGPEFANMNRLVHEFGLEKTVRLYPNVSNEDVQQLHAHADALVLASTPIRTWQEQFGYVLAEAILSYCPVISTTSGAIPEIVETAGILVPGGNPVALASAFQQMDQPAVRNALRAECVRVREKYTADAYCQRLAGAYKSLLV